MDTKGSGWWRVHSQPPSLEYRRIAGVARPSSDTGFACSAESRRTDLDLWWKSVSADSWICDDGRAVAVGPERVLFDAAPYRSSPVGYDHSQSVLCGTCDDAPSARSFAHRSALPLCSKLPSGSNVFVRC